MIPLIRAAALLSCSLSFAQETAGAPYAKEEGEFWIAGNNSLEIAISHRTGTIQRLVDKISREDYCNQAVRGAVPARTFVVGQRMAGISLLDELRDKEFSDLAQDAAVSRWQAFSSAGAVSLSFDKTFPGAEFIVTETFRVYPDHLRWDVRIHKRRGADRTVRVVQFVPLPLGGYQGWAPIGDRIPSQPYTPFAVEYGQSVSGSVGEARWRTNIPMMVYYSRDTGRAISFTSPFEVPAVRIRFLNNTSAMADFHWNSRHYPPRERPYLQVTHEYLGLRDTKDIEAGLLIAAHPAGWRPALGWVYSRYRQYFDPDPRFDQWDGVYVSGAELMKDDKTEADLRGILARRRALGARWEEQHGHFPWYGLMIPSPDVKSWMCESHPLPGATITREKMREHSRRNREYGIGTFVYYNLTEAEHWYAEKEFPESIARDEDGKPIGAFRAERYPDRRACWLMNADERTPFGQHMIRQAREMVQAYPEIAGFFWDVYGRSYMFDFAHDDGLTMVHNKPAYYSEFVFQRIMERVIGPLLHGRGMTITANKPVTIASARGVDGIMVIENTPEEETPWWIQAQSFLGLSRHVMILDGDSGSHPEKFFQNCLRYGMLYSELGTTEGRKPLAAEKLAANAGIERAYAPFIQRLRGKKWIFYPQALELPANTDGNIFRLRDGSVMVTLISAWRTFRGADGYDRNVRVVCRLPDAATMTHVYAASLDQHENSRLTPERSGNTLTITVPKHDKSTVLILSPRPDPALEASLRTRRAVAALKR